MQRQLEQPIPGIQRELQCARKPRAHPRLQNRADGQPEHFAQLQSFFRYDDDLQDYVNESANETGNYGHRVDVATAFVDDDSTYTNPVWLNFLASRRFISERQNELNYNDELNEIGYAPGFGPISQNVVVPAFMAAYLGLEAQDVPLDVFQAPVRPNWRVSYDGLSKNRR